MEEKIFKAYDIRGIYPQQLSDHDAFIIARAYATMMQQENPKRPLRIAVGRDMRLSSPALHAQVVAGLTNGGLQVVDVGLVSTPAFYFAVAYYHLDGGMQVSASHNPKEYNGLKMVRARGVPIGRNTGMEELKKLSMKTDWPVAAGKGTVETLDEVTRTMAKEQQKGLAIQSIKPFTIVVDAANAMGAQDVEAMFSDLPCRIIKLNFNLDGTFPVHQPDPLDDKNLQILQTAVVEYQADLGIAPDGDGDRYFFVDERGQIIRQEILRGIMAQIALAEQPGATVAYDIRPGRITLDMILAVGGKPIVTPVGHSLIKSEMIKAGAVFGGESSGHYFYQFPYGTFESPVMLVTKFLIWLSQQNTPVSEAIRPYQKYFHSGEINSKVTDVQQTLAVIQRAYADGKVSNLDGVTVEYDDWWFNVRGSNTEPLIRLNLEAQSRALMEQKRDEVLSHIRK